jgi:hypothetical protein
MKTDTLENERGFAMEFPSLETNKEFFLGQEVKFPENIKARPRPSLGK